jgi:tRNA 5-methylaminomethyl-2-thiouridine biosynthesis bifunctional protein
MSESGSADPVLPAARVALHRGQPYSLDFEDIYHAADGDAEVQRVFLGPTALDDLAAEQARRSGPAAVVRIGELGFGSGLNFVLAAERCLAAGARLHFVTVEAAPIDAAAFAVLAAARASRTRCTGPWRTSTRPVCAAGIGAGWPMDASACRCGSATPKRGSPTWRAASVSPWMPGFSTDSPRTATRPCGEPELMRRVAALSRRGTRVATFTAAGRVRRALSDAGFAMTRVDQRPHKRESLAGTLMAGAMDGFEPPPVIHVAGAGLAGASAAWHLARAGHAVRVWDPGSAGAGALPGSAMPVTVLHGRLLADATPAADARCHAYLYAADLLRGLAGFTPPAFCSGRRGRRSGCTPSPTATRPRAPGCGGWTARKRPRSPTGRWRTGACSCPAPAGWTCRRWSPGCSTIRASR